MTGAAPRSTAYQIVLVLLLSLNFGIVFFDRNALSILMPFIQSDLGLSNTQIGIVSSALSLTWALSGYYMGRYSDRTGRRKAVIIGSTILFSLCSVVSGLATSFMMLLLARLLMGCADGGVLPTSQSLTGIEVEARHRGLAMGVMQNLGASLLGSVAAPLLLIPLATAMGWRNAFYIAAIPGLITAVMIMLFVRETRPPVVDPAGAGSRLSTRDALRERNVFLSAIIAVLMVSYLVVGYSFLPLFLTRFKGLSPSDMSLLMAALGVSAAIASFVVPALSDHLGRKPIMIVFAAMGSVVPVAGLYTGDSLSTMFGLFALGWTSVGTFSIFMATIPSEAVDPRHTATTLGLTMGAGELIGGVLSPLAAGALADRFGLSAIMWLMGILCIAAAITALGLRETAPNVVRRAKSVTA